MDLSVAIEILDGDFDHVLPEAWPWENIPGAY